MNKTTEQYGTSTLRVRVDLLEGTFIISLFRMPNAAPKHDRSEQPTPQPDDGLATGPCTSLDCHPTESGDAPCVINLAEVALDEKTADDASSCEKEADALKESSEHDLLQQLSASAIESCRGTDFAEPRCYLHVFGFKSPEMEATYLAYHSCTALIGHRINAGASALYLLFRIINLIRGVNTLEADALSTFYLCTLGAAAVLSAACGVHFSEQEVKHRQSLARASTGIGLLVLSGSSAQIVSVIYFQTDWHDSISETFQMAYYLGAMMSILPAFCLVMLRTPFLLCASFQIVMGGVIICSSYSLGLSKPAYLASPLLQVAKCPPPKVLTEI